MTNADKIRTMSDKELTELLQDCCRGATHDAHECSEISCFDCRMDWLRKPYKEDA
jgi:hypothetical protein